MKYLFASVFICFAYSLKGQQINKSNFIYSGVPESFENTALFRNSELSFALFEFDQNLFSNNNNQNLESDLRGFTSVIIGTTYLDLQTNASICNALFRNEDGKISAVWNFAPVADVTLTTRGTGYNYFNGSSWLPEPTLRVENAKTGWPSILVTNQNEEYILCHNLDSGRLHFNYRSTSGSGLWNETPAMPAPNSKGAWWPRLVRGGSGFGNDYLHAVALTLPAYNGGEMFLGMDGALLYYRSSDNGSTWDTCRLIESIDSTQYFRIRPDNYVIDAYQNNVAIVVGGYGNDIVLLSSYNDGADWTKTIIQNFPIDTFDDQVTDTTGDGIPETLETNDGSLSVLIDNSGAVHVWAGYAKMINTDSTDNGISFYPTANGILYWNTNMGSQPMKIITGALDLNYNGTIDAPGYGFFNTGFATHPSAGLDASGNMYLSYSAICELGKDQDEKTVRHTYIVSSSNGGQTWSYPYDVVPEQNAEGIYGCLARTNDNNIRLIYQKDFCAGISTTVGFPDPCNIAELSSIIYVEAPAVEILNSVSVNEIPDETKSIIFPNPSEGEINLLLPLQNSTASVFIYDMKGKIMYEGHNLNFPEETVDLNYLADGLYLVQISSPEFRLSEKISILR